MFTTLAYLMPEAYSKPCQIFKMIRHVDYLDIVRTEQFIQAFSGIFRNISISSDILRDIEAYSGIIEAYLAMFGHIQTSV